MTCGEFSVLSYWIGVALGMLLVTILRAAWRAYWHDVVERLETGKPG